MELTLDQALQKGIEAHKAGKAQEADRYYTAILKANPSHPDANHNMGVLAVGVGKVEEALPFFKTALEVNRTIGQYWLSYIDALIKLDRMDDAKATLDQAKSNGAKGDAFDQLEKSLAGLEKVTEVDVTSKKWQEPPEDQIQPLINLYTHGQMQQALIKAQELLSQSSNSLTLYNIIGAASQGLGQLDEAVQAYKKAIELKPDYADAYYNMGNALKQQGKLDLAIEAYKKAISFKSHFVQAYYNMGNTYQLEGRSREAIKSYQKVISIKPDDAQAHYNMGIALKEKGKPEEAIQAYKNAISIKPDYAEAYNNMGNVLKKQGNLEEAIESFKKAISIKPDLLEAFNNMGNVLKNNIFKKPDKGLQNVIETLIAEKSLVRPVDIAKAAISLLKLEPTLQKHLQLADDGVIDSPLDVISDIIQFPLLLKLMSVCPLPDLELENLLKTLRSSILSNILSLKQASPELLRFQSVLALQCFTNEYIYNTTGEEEAILNRLEASVEKDLENNEQPNPQTILALASYKALNQYDWCKLLVVTDHLNEIFARQVEEQNQEQKLKKQIPILEEITNNISSEVRYQYEESPYPRWVNLRLSTKPMSVSKLITEAKLKIYNKKINEVEKPEILIAGCGTGQHPIETASRFKGSIVLAIDLSLSSLAYAKRKTDELNIENIEYMQADILDVGKLNKQFDIIESGGVLHHMDDPMAGWKVLTDRLKPGGLMKIGLYSELARQHIVKIREEITQQNTGSSEEEMRSFRDIISKSDTNHHQQITISSDFYSLSTLRDLLFHVQEHRFTIPLIQKYLDKLELKFCGFESKQITSDFKLTNTHTKNLYDLGQWHAFEEANPRSFIGMYQFWCQKVD